MEDVYFIFLVLNIITGLKCMVLLNFEPSIFKFSIKDYQYENDNIEKYKGIIFFSYIIPYKRSWKVSLFTTIGFILCIWKIVIFDTIKDQYENLPVDITFYKIIKEIVFTRFFAFAVIISSGLGAIPSLFIKRNLIDNLLKEKHISEINREWVEKKLFRKDWLHAFVFNSKFLVSLCAGITLILATQPKEIAYYEMIRFFITFYTFVLIASEENYFKTIIFIPILLLFNPIFKVHLDQEIWKVIDIACASIFIMYAIMEVKKYFTEYH